jgi:hypothetical protein
MSNAFTQYCQALGKGLGQGTTATWRQTNTLAGFAQVVLTPMAMRPAVLVGNLATNVVIHSTTAFKETAAVRKAAAPVAALPQAAAAAAGAQAQPGAIFIVPPVKTASGS